MSGSVTSNIDDLNDADILALEKVVNILNAKQGKILNLDAFQREAKERFFNAGFRVDVKVYTTNQDRTHAFDIEILERLEGEFDPDQMVYEATNDILDIGEKGVISTKGLWTP